MRFLALDIGDKRTGIATGDDVTGLVSPIGFTMSGQGDFLPSAVARAVEEHGPDALVVGLPINMDGTHGPRARKIAQIAEEIAKRTGLPIHLHDERLTSFDADKRMARSGLTHKQKRDRRDALAAMAILEDFLRARKAGQTSDEPESKESD